MIKGFLKTALNLALIVGAVGIVGESSQLMAVKAGGLFVTLTHLVISAITNDIVWWARKPLWASGRILAKTYDEYGIEHAPPFVWQRDADAATRQSYDAVPSGDAHVA